MAKSTQKSAEKTIEETIPPLGREKLPEEVQQKASAEVEQRDPPAEVTPLSEDQPVRPGAVVCEACQVPMRVTKSGRTTRLYKCPGCGRNAQKMKETVAQALQRQKENRQARQERLRARAEASPREPE